MVRSRKRFFLRTCWLRRRPQESGTAWYFRSNAYVLSELMCRKCRGVAHRFHLRTKIAALAPNMTRIARRHEHSAQAKTGRATLMGRRFSIYDGPASASPATVYPALELLSPYR